mmetsp:Transcript_20374/g.44537  ORF Transcript_20374/g.44537 Transcript_20374/m.44537 type:complete len:292 (-) Transcript_20374:1960-2835(-)
MRPWSMARLPDRTVRCSRDRPQCGLATRWSADTSSRALGQPSMATGSTRCATLGQPMSQAKARMRRALVATTSLLMPGGPTLAAWRSTRARSINSASLPAVVRRGCRFRCLPLLPAATSAPASPHLDPAAAAAVVSVSLGTPSNSRISWAMAGSSTTSTGLHTDMNAPRTISTLATPTPCSGGSVTHAWRPSSLGRGTSLLPWPWYRTFTSSWGRPRPDPCRVRVAGPGACPCRCPWLPGPVPALRMQREETADRMGTGPWRGTCAPGFKSTREVTWPEQTVATCRSSCTA